MNFRPSFRFPLQASALSIALTLAACGGGGGDAPPSSVQTQQSAQASSQQNSVAAPTGGSSQTAQATQPAPETTTVATAPVETTTSASGTLARSGRSLNWWGIPPLDLFNSNLNCSPQPTCRIPDGDLAVWNATCQPGDRTCYVPLSTEPQVAPLPRSEETTALATPRVTP